MAESKKLRIFDREFSSKKDAKKCFSEMLNRYELRKRVSDPHDHNMLKALFDLHPERESKLAGCEVSHFEVHPFKHGSRCFFLVRSDGSNMDFSFKRIIDLLRKYDSNADKGIRRKCLAS